MKKLIRNLLKKGKVMVFNLTFWGAIIIAGAIIVGVGSKYVFKKDDHPIEELAERILKEQTGIDIDFTPLTKELKRIYEKNEKEKNENIS